MSKLIEVQIVSVEKTIFDGEASWVFVTGIEGELGIAPGHMPLISPIKPGSIRIVTGDDEINFFVSGGTVEVQPKKVTILADTVIRAEDLDEAAAISAQAAKARLHDQKSEIDYSTALAELAAAAAQYRLIKQRKSGGRS